VTAMLRLETASDIDQAPEWRVDLRIMLVGRGPTGVKRRGPKAALHGKARTALTPAS